MADGEAHGGRPRVLAIFGPTASGKTAVAEAIAERLPAELISADSAQVYHGLPILTNQSPRPARLVAVWDLGHEASVAEYARLAHEAVDEVLAAGRLPVVVGGTGLYLRAALAELDLPPAPPAGARKRWLAAYEELGPAAAHALLGRRDPAAAAAVHPNDRRRVVRALELTDLGHSLAPRRAALWSEETRHPTLLVGLHVSPGALALRIEARTRAMFDAGVEAEVRAALASPLSTTAAKLIGLQEVAGLPRAEAVAAIALRTRQYAAYQRKWLRRLAAAVPVDGEREPAAVADDVLAELARATSRTT